MTSLFAGMQKTQFSAGFQLCFKILPKDQSLTETPEPFWLDPVIGSCYPPISGQVTKVTFFPWNLKKKYFKQFFILAGMQRYSLCVVKVSFILCKFTPPWGRVLLGNLIVPNQAKTFPAFYRTRMFITVFTKRTVQQYKCIVRRQLRPNVT